MRSEQLARYNDRSKRNAVLKNYLHFRNSMILSQIAFLIPNVF